MVGIRWHYVRISQDMPYVMGIVSRCFQYFPYSFSDLFTVAFTVFTSKILRVISTIMFLITVTSNFILTIPIYNFQSGKCITASVYYILPVFLNSLGILCTVAVHLYILYFALRRPDLNALKGNFSKSCDRKTLTNTIICICISQLICVIPFLLFQLLVPNGRIPDKQFSDINPWLNILAYSQCFYNAPIIHKNKKNRKIFKQTHKEITMNCKSWMRTRWWTLKDPKDFRKTNISLRNIIIAKIYFVIAFTFSLSLVTAK